MINQLSQEVFLEASILLVLTGILLALMFLVFYFRKVIYRVSQLDIKDILNLIYRSNFRYSRYQNYTYMPLFQADIENFIVSAEVERNFRISPEARAMLIQPLLEYYRDEPHDMKNDQLWRTSLSVIISALDEQLPGERNYYNLNRVRRNVTAMNVFQAVNSKWCTVPPYCRPKE